jgi:hypothetical protein
LWRKLQQSFLPPYMNAIVDDTGQCIILLWFFSSTPLLSLYLEIPMQPMHDWYTCRMIVVTGMIVSPGSVSSHLLLLHLVVYGLPHHTDSHVNLQPHRAINTCIYHSMYLSTFTSPPLSYFHSRRCFPHGYTYQTKDLQRKHVTKQSQLECQCSATVFPYWRSIRVGHLGLAPFTRAPLSTVCSCQSLA